MKKVTVIKVKVRTVELWSLAGSSEKREDLGILQDD